MSGCSGAECPGVVKLERPSVVCADPRRVYPEVVSECGVHRPLGAGCPSVESRISG